MPPIPVGAVGGAAGGAAAGGAAGAAGGAAAGGAGAAAGGAGGLGAAGGSFEAGFGKGAGFNPQSIAQNLEGNKLVDRRTQETQASSRDQEINDIMNRDSSELSDEEIEDAGGSSGWNAQQPASYAKEKKEKEETAEEGPFKGGGAMMSPEMEILQSQQKQRQMNKTREQLIPDQQAQQPTGGGPQAQSISGQGSSSESDEGEEEEEEEGDQEGERQQAMQMQQQQRQSAMARAKQRLKDEAIERLKAKIRERLAKRAANAGLRATVEGTEVATAETVVPLIILVAELEIQLINKYFFTPLFFKGWNELADDAIDGAPFFDQSFPEDIIAVYIFLQMNLGPICFNPMCWPCLGIFLFISIIGGGAHELANKVPFP